MFQNPVNALPPPGVLLAPRPSPESALADFQIGPASEWKTTPTCRLVPPATRPCHRVGGAQAAIMRRVVLLPLLAAVLLLSGCSWIFESFVSDSATRFAYQLRDEAAALRRSGAKTRTYEHRPQAWPDGPDGDYRIEFVGPPESNDGRRALMTAKSYDGPLWSSTTYHLNFVRVPLPLKAAHRKGEPTRVTLELRDGTVLVTALK
jgi:hypothetical protein